MDIISRIAEERIRKAMEAGEFDNLRGAGSPLVFEDESWIPEELRLAYRMLRNSGCIPVELDLRSEIISLRRLIGTLDDDSERLKKLRELNFKILKLNMTRKRPLCLDDFPEYEDRIFERSAGK